MFSAETLMRRFCGVEAAGMLAVVNWVLWQATNRGRLGASTFKTLNATASAVNLFVRPSLGCMHHVRFRLKLLQRRAER